MPARSEVAEIVRAAREARGWSQRQLARRAGVGSSMIALLEGGQTAVPKRDNLVAVAIALGLNHLDMLEKAGMLTSEERLALGRLVTFPEFMQSRHLPLTTKQRQMLCDVYESLVGRS